MTEIRSSAFPRSTTLQNSTKAVTENVLNVENSTSNEILTDEEKNDLLINARSIDRLIKWSSCFMRCDNGLLCKYCGTCLVYDFTLGDSFTDSILPDAFRQLKYNLKRHLKCDKHLVSSKNYLIEQEQARQLENAGKMNALNCANAAYMTYKMNISYESYENVISVLHNSGCTVGVKNHSKEFPRLFLPVVHSVLQKEINSFIIDNDLPFGIVADKITVNHRSRHIVGLRIPVFDINRDNLFHSVYLEHNFVNDFTGHGLACSILSTLNKFGFDLAFLRKKLVGLAVDGQYIKLGVANHIKEKLSLNYVPASWDMMHRIELIQKHSEMPDIIKKAHCLINDSMKEFMYGSKYEKLLKSSEEFSDFFYKPKIFKTMKFASHCKDVFKTFIADYKSLVSVCEQNPDMFSLRDKLLSKSTLFHILLLSDIYNILSKCSKCVQSVDNLPWEYLQLMNNLDSDLEIFLQYIESIVQLRDTKELCECIKSFPTYFFSHTKTSIEMFESCTYQDIPLPDLPVSSKNLRTINSTVLNECNQLIKNYTSDMNSFVKFVKSLREQFDVYSNSEIQSVDEMLKRAGYLFNFDFLQFPRTDVSVEQSSEYKGFTCETFHEYIDAFPFYSLFKFDQQTLWFEFQQLCEWFCKNINSNRTEKAIFNIKALIKLAVIELKNKYPYIIKFLTYVLAIPVSEAICESWGSVINDVMLRRPMANDGNINELGTTDMRVYILLNGPPPGYKNTRKILKAALVEKYGISYYKHFKYISTSVINQKCITSKVVSRILDDSSGCLPCFE